MDIKKMAYSPIRFLYDKEHGILLSSFLKKIGLFGKVISYGYVYPLKCNSRSLLPFSFQKLPIDEIRFWSKVETDYIAWLAHKNIKWCESKYVEDKIPNYKALLFNEDIEEWFNG